MASGNGPAMTEAGGERAPLLGAAGDYLRESIWTQFYESRLWKLLVFYGGMVFSHAMWDFAIALILFLMSGRDLLLPAVYGLVYTVTLITLAAAVKNNAVQVNRLTFTYTVVTFGAIFMFFAVFCLAFWYKSKHPSNWLTAGVIIFSSLTSSFCVLSQKAVVSLWLMPIMETDDGQRQVNNFAFSTSLIARITAPFVVAVLLMAGSPLICAIVIGACYLIISLNAYLWLPDMQTVILSKNTSPGLCRSLEALERASSYMDGFWPQGMAVPSIAYGFLHMSHLAFSYVLLAYLWFMGLGPIFLAIFVAVALVGGGGIEIGLNSVVKGVGPVGSACFGIWWNILSMAACFVSTLVDSKFWSIFLLVAGVISGRWAVQCYERSMARFLYTRVEAECIPSILWFAHSCKAILLAGAFVLAIIYSNPQDFPILVYFSFATACVAALLYTGWCIFAKEIPPLVDDVNPQPELETLLVLLFLDPTFM